MSATAIVLAAQSILQAALDAADLADCTVTLGAPEVPSADTLLYLLHNGQTDVPKANNLIRRQHAIQLHLLVRVTTDESSVETRFLGLADVVSDCYYTHRKLSNTCASSDIHQQDGNSGNDNTQYLTTREGATYRHRWWTLTAHEDIGYAMA